MQQIKLISQTDRQNDRQTEYQPTHAFKEITLEVKDNVAVTTLPDYR